MSPPWSLRICSHSPLLLQTNEAPDQGRAEQPCQSQMYFTMKLFFRCLRPIARLSFHHPIAVRGCRPWYTGRCGSQCMFFFVFWSAYRTYMQSVCDKSDARGVRKLKKLARVFISHFLTKEKVALNRVTLSPSCREDRD